MLAWIEEHQASLLWTAAATVGFVIVSTLLVCVVIVRIPADHFSPNARRSAGPGSSAAGWHGKALHIGKNVLAWLLIIAGIVMLIFPGPGLLVGLVGIMLADFPGKHRLERWIISRHGILKTMNALRKRFDRPPLELHAAASG